ncbi:MAG: chromosomal replication initiator protein DnaA [Candidatus Coatesbacteria bacterium]|nr:MAG: chromosomal replication initiator protein DnaA [Candidatus Coatesbacteria bacterium]
MAKSTSSRARVWRDIYKRLAAELDRKECETWLRPVTCRGVDGDTLHLEVPNNLYREFITEKYLGLLEAKARELLGPEVKVELRAVVGQEGLFLANTSRDDDAAKYPAPKVSKLNPLYTFDTFVVGRSNSFCHAASRAVAQNPGARYNPLFIYGGVGLGKTHLLHAIGHETLGRGNGIRVSYLSCDHFMNEMIAAVKNNRTDAFRRKYRNVDFLLVDDIQFLAGMEGTQVEFFHTFNALYEAGSQIVLSSDRAPRDIPEVEDRLRTRFEWGLIADIQAPDYETRRAIIARKAELKHIAISDEVADLIATRLTTNIRAIEGVLNRLFATAQHTGTSVSFALAQDILNELVPEERRLSLSLDQLQEATAKYFNLSRRDLISKTRRANVARARQIAMYLCREKTNSSLADIGLAFGNRDHTTVLYSISKIEGAVASAEEKTVKILKDLERNLDRLGPAAN